MVRRSSHKPVSNKATLHAETLESRDLASANPAELPLIQQPRERYAVASTGGGIAQVNVYDAKTNSLLGIVNPAGSNAVPLSVATGDVTGDGIEDLIVSGGKGTAPFVKVYDGKNLREIGTFEPYSKTFFGGVTVAVGDVNGDGRKDIVTGAGVGSAAQVKVFSGSALFPAGNVKAAVTPNPIRNFIAFDTSYRGGVNVAAGDIDGDGATEIIVGKATGNAMDVRAFSGKTGSTLADFSAFDPTFKGGVTVAAGDTNGDGKAEIVVGANVAPANNVKVFRGSVMVAQYSAGTGNSTRVGTTDINGDGIVELVSVSGPASPPRVNVLSSQTGAVLRTSPAMPKQYSQGLSVG